MSYHGISPPSGGSLEQLWKYARDIYEVLRRVMQGKINVRTTLTFRDGETTTVLQDPRIGASSHISLTPLTANAKTAWLTHYISAQTTASVTFTHANAADVDQNFSVLIVG